ncbi:hypothetical protein [Mesorhizobium sp. ANAO-SY3R2]|uniref:hypothetical protein n=1 Tax=Mesorhizobium sp. ANAO-SY3R2 TaxID=3166644 RepID=UPI0036720A87
MKAAWRKCRAARTFNGKFLFSRAAFAKALKEAWFEAKEQAGTLSQEQTQKAKRAATVRAEIDALQFKSFRYDTVSMRRALETQLAALSA